MEVRDPFTIFDCRYRWLFTTVPTPRFVIRDILVNCDHLWFFIGRHCHDSRNIDGYLEEHRGLVW